MWLARDNSVASWPSGNLILLSIREQTLKLISIAHVAKYFISLSICRYNEAVTWLLHDFSLAFLIFLSIGKCLRNVLNCFRVLGCAFGLCLKPKVVCAVCFDTRPERVHSRVLLVQLVFFPWFSIGSVGCDGWKSSHYQSFFSCPIFKRTQYPHLIVSKYYGNLVPF